MQWKRDWGLTGRVVLTGFLLFLVYLVFMSVLWMFGAGLWFIVLLAVGMGLVQYLFSDRLVLWSTGAKVVEENEYPELHRVVRELSRKADLPMPKVAIMPSPVPNAFATGRSPRHAVVAVTDSVMRLLNRNELEAVIAHELSHIRNRDILTMTFASFISMIASIIMQSFFFAGLFGGSNGDRGNGGVVIWIVSIIVWFISTLLIMALSRYREFAADRGSAYITQNPRALISALYKISGRMDTVPAQAKARVEGANAFFIIPALSGNTLMELFSTHPPLEKRVANLEKAEAEIRGY